MRLTHAQMRLTPAQRKILDAIRAHGCAQGSTGRATVRIPGYPHRVRMDTIQTLKHLGYLRTDVLCPKVGKYPGGGVNNSAVSRLIYVPIDAPFPVEADGRYLSPSASAALKATAKEDYLARHLDERRLDTGPCR